MTSALLLSLAACVTAAGDSGSAQFVFHDAAAHSGRSVLHFRALEFAKSPVRPLVRAVAVVSGPISILSSRRSI